MRKKFKQEEVEKLIAGIREAYETKIRRLEYRNEGLVSENRTLRASLAEMKSRESKVGKALVAAETKGEEIKLFADKWKRLAAQMAGVIPKDDAEKYTKFADDLAALLGKEKGKFRAENGASPDEEPFDPKAVIGKYIESEEEDTGFNLDDVLNPKGELDLEKLCRDLGLMDD